MKFNEPKVKIISRGVDQTVDFVFSDNFCPCCGTNYQEALVKSFSKKGLLFTYHMRQAIINCSSCGTVFQKEVCDSKELTDISDTVFFFSLVVIILSALSFLFFCFFDILIGYVISLIILLISFAVCGMAASD